MTSICNNSKHWPLLELLVLTNTGRYCTISLQLFSCDMQLLFNYDFITHHHHPDRRDVNCFTTAAFN